MRLAVIALAVGCYGPSAPTGAPCTDTCPSGQVCERGFCRLPGGGSPDAPIDGAPDSDPDGDGIVNALDNCDAIANVDQHDEDGDDAGDVCDGCPHRVDSGADGDGDGVGDACDPNPAAAGERIALFDPFVGPRLGWTLSPGWTYAGDRLHAQTSTGEYAVLVQPTGSSVIEIGGEVAWRPALPRQISLTFGRMTDYHYCEWYEDGEGAYAGLTRASGSSFTAIAHQGFPALITGRFVATATERAAQQVADCKQELAGRIDQLGGPTPGATTGDRIGIDVAQGVFDIDYLIQIELP